MASIGKTALIEKVSESTGYAKKDVAEITNSILNTIAASLQSGDTVTITGFGTFSVKKVSAHDGVNPQTHEKIKIAAANRVHFKAGGPFKTLVNTKPKKKDKVDLTKKKSK